MKRSICSPRIAALLCVIIGSTDALALDPNKTLDQYLYRRWGSEDGLPQGSAYSITQTQDGHLWFGTQGGLVRFDGRRLEAFAPNNSEGLAFAWTSAIEESANGDLWLGGHPFGLARRRNNVFTDFTTEELAQTEGTSDLLEDTEGVLWIATQGGGLHRFQNGQFGKLRKSDGLASDWVNALTQRKNGDLWVATELGINVLRQGTIVRTIGEAEGLPHKRVTQLLEDKQQQMWIGTGDGICHYRKNQCQRYGTEQGLTDLNVRALFQDSDGNIWVGTHNGGVFVLRGDKFVSEGRHEGLDEEIVSVFEDRENNLYVGSTAHGLFQLRDGKVTTLLPLRNRAVWNFLEDDDGSFWVGTSGGAVQYRKEVKRVYDKESGLTNDVVLAMAKSSKKGIWAGTNGAGVAYLEDGSVTMYSEFEGMDDMRIRALYEDHEGYLWIGTKTSGLFKWKDGQVHSRFTIDNGMPANGVVGIIRARRGGLWAATYGGLVHIENGRVTRVMEEAGLERTRVYGLFEDSEGNVWIGSSGGGAWLYRNGKFTNYLEKDGGLCNVIYNVIDDKRGNIWMSGDAGIARVSKQEFFDFADKKIKRIEPQVLGTADGMKDKEAAGGCQYSALKLSDGQLWFATVAGGVNVDPTKITSNPAAPPVVVKNVSADKRRIVPFEQLPAGTSSVAFEFAALSLVAPNQNKTRYMLEGYDKDWSDPSDKISERYTNLSSGRYVFRVQGSNNDGVWNETSASFEFSVKAHFWQTWWFWTLVGLLGALGIWEFTRWRERVTARRNLELSELSWERTRKVLEEQVELIRDSAADASEVSRELQESMKALATSSEQVASASHETATTVEELEQTSKGAERSAAQIVDVSAQTKEVSVKGLESVQHTSDLMATINEDSASIAEKSRDLLRGLDEVDAITHMVKAIADRSKILAINASIEAVKAGDAGVGFGVVAKKMKELALQSGGSTKEIDQFLSRFRTLSRDIATIATEGRDRTLQGSTASARSGEIVNTLAEEVQSNAQMANAIASTIHQQMVAMKYIGQAVEQIKDAASQNTDISGTIADSSAKLNDAIDQLLMTIAKWRTPEFYKQQ